MGRCACGEAVKKLCGIILCFILAALPVGGCTMAGSNTPAAKDKVQVYTSFYALYDFAKKIGGDRAEVYNIMPTGADAHDWEPSPKDMASLEQADILFYNGLHMEHWVEKVQRSIASTRLAMVMVSENIPDPGEDPHVWLNPRYALMEMERMKDALSEADPENSAYYEENYSQVKAQIEALDTSFKQAGLEGGTLVVGHAAYGHLCSAYGLTQRAVDGMHAEGGPSAGQMGETVAFIKAQGIRYIFTHPHSSSKVMETIAAETGAELLYLNPFEGLTQEEMDKGMDYFSVMEENLQNLKKAVE